jgi:AcrR family transcriptional regulator
MMDRRNSVKNRIVDTASRLFYQQGFNSTGINQIIAEAGVAIGSLYKHHQSKNDLLYHYLQEQGREYFINLDNYLKNEEQPLQKLLKLIDYRINVQRKAGYSGCHFIKINAEVGRKDKRVAQLVAGHKRKQRSYINEIVSEIGETRNLPMEKDSLVNAIFLMIEGAVVSTSILGNTDDLKAVKKTVIKLF